LEGSLLNYCDKTVHFNGGVRVTVTPIKNSLYAKNPTKIYNKKDTYRYPVLWNLASGHK
jgi:hypothetical protein